MRLWPLVLRPYLIKAPTLDLGAPTPRTPILWNSEASTPRALSLSFKMNQVKRLSSHSIFSFLLNLAFIFYITLLRQPELRLYLLPLDLSASSSSAGPFSFIFFCWTFWLHLLPLDLSASSSSARPFSFHFLLLNLSASFFLLFLWLPMSLQLPFSSASFGLLRTEAF